MANVKITELSEATTPTTDDLVAIVDDPGGTPVTKKSTLANLLTVALTAIRALTPAANKIPVYTSGSAASALEITEQTIVGRLTGGIIKAVSQTELTALLNAATTSLQGAAPLATDVETIAGTEAAKTVTPATLAAKLDTDGTLAGNLDTRIPTQKAVKTYADTMVTKALFDANTILAATSDNTPAAVTVAEQTIVGRLTGGAIKALTVAEARELLTPADKTPVNAVAGSGTLTVTGGGTQIADNDTVTIDTKVYTFKTALTPTEGEVLIGASDTATLLNLLNAINHTGTPDTDYKCAAVHPTVTGTSSDATTLVVTAKTKGVAGNSIATTETGAELSWGAVNLEGGIDGTVGYANEVCADATYLYHAVAANTIADANWRRIALGSAY